MAFSSKAEEIVSEATGVERNLPGPTQQTIAGSGPGGTRAPDLLVRGRRGSVRLKGTIIEVKRHLQARGASGRLPSRAQGTDSRRSRLCEAIAGSGKPSGRIQS